MAARYLVVFFIGWGFNLALDANIVARETLSWLQSGWFASFYETAAGPSQSRRK